MAKLFVVRGLLLVACSLWLAAPLRLCAQSRTMGLMYYDSTRTFPGYTLFAPIVHNVAYLIDNQGRLVHSWNAPSNPSLAVSLLNDGNLLHSGGRPAGDMDIRNWDNTQRWSFGFSGDSFIRTHDLMMLPNGHILTVAWELKSEAQALAAGRDTAKLTSAGLKPAFVVEIDTSTNQVVWEWHAWDHLVQDFDSTKQNFGSVRSHPELVDLNYGMGVTSDPGYFIHFNAVAYNPDLDQVMLSPLMYSEVWVIDHSTTTQQARGHTGGRHGRGGDLLYRWGNPETYRRGDSLRHRMFAQWDPHWIADSLPGAGHMIAFSSGGHDRRWSDVEEWIAPIDSMGFYHLGLDSTYGPQNPVWEFRDSTWFFSLKVGSAQRLPNGNTLICEGLRGTFFEVTHDSQIVWKYIAPVDSLGPMHQGDSLWEGLNQVFRCCRFGPGFPGFQGRSLVPGDPIEIYPSGATEPRHTNALGQVRLAAAPSLVRSRAVVVLTLPVLADVELAVFDCRGVRVATLTQGRLPSGQHRFAWDAASAAAGVYFCRLRSGVCELNAKLLKLE